MNSRYEGFCSSLSQLISTNISGGISLEIAPRLWMQFYPSWIRGWKWRQTSTACVDGSTKTCSWALGSLMSAAETRPAIGTTALCWCILQTAKSGICLFSVLYYILHLQVLACMCLLFMLHYCFGVTDSPYLPVFYYNPLLLYLYHLSGMGKGLRRSQLFTRPSTTWSSWWQLDMNLTLLLNCAK